MLRSAKVLLRIEINIKDNYSRLKVVSKYSVTDISDMFFMFNL
jgi:hypothetical protein